MNCLPKPNLPKFLNKEPWSKGRIGGRLDFSDPFIQKHLGNWGWTEFEEDVVLPFSTILPLIQDDKYLVKLPLEDVAWRGKHCFPMLAFNQCPCCKGRRYKVLDLSFPIIVTDMSNPYNDKYRTLDGSHRCAQMTNIGHTHAWAFYLPFSLLKQHFVPR